FTGGPDGAHAHGRARPAFLQPRAALPGRRSAGDTDARIRGERTVVDGAVAIVVDAVARLGRRIRSPAAHGRAAHALERACAASTHGASARCAGRDPVVDHSVAVVVATVAHLGTRPGGAHALDRPAHARVRARSAVTHTRTAHATDARVGRERS